MAMATATIHSSTIRSVHLADDVALQRGTSNFGLTFCHARTSRALPGAALKLKLSSATTVQPLGSWPGTRSAEQKSRTFRIRSQAATEEPTIDNSTVLVVGGGGVGLETVKALSKAGSWVTAYQRSDKFRKDIEDLGAMLAIGDVLDPVTIEKTFKSNNFDAVVCTVGGGTANVQVDKDGPINLINAAKKAGVKRFILISSIGAGESVKALDARTLEVLKVVLKAKEEAEEYLKESGLEYTVIRPGGLLGGTPPSGNGVLTEDTSIAGLINRADVASLVLKILFDNRTTSKIYQAIDIGRPLPPDRSLDDIELLEFL